MISYFGLHAHVTPVALVRALWGRLLPATVISPNEQLYKSPKTCFNQVLGLRMLSRQEDLRFGNARGIRK